MANSAINISANAQEVINLRKRIDELKAALSSMRRSTDPAAYDKLNRELQTSSVRYNRLVGDIQRYVSQQQQAERATRGTTSSMSNMQGILAKIGGTAALVQLGKQIVNVHGEMQQLNIAFSTMLKSQEKADALMSGLKTFASDTPFGLMDSAKGAKQLLAYGTQAENIIGDLKMLGNVASGVSAPLGDIVYLYGTLRSQGRAYAVDIRQFAGRGIPIYAELAKVLKVNVDQVNELVSAGKVGFPEVEQAFKNMTSGGGMFEGLMEKQTASVTGQIEKLKDNIQFMFDAIGTSSEGAIYGAIDGASTLVENYETVGKVLLGLIATYGAYKTAVILLSTVENIRYQSTLAQMAGYSRLAVITELLTAKTAALNKVLMNNAYAILAAAAVALAYGIYQAVTATSKLEDSQKRVNDITESFNASIENERLKLDLLFERFKNAKKGTDEYKKAKDDIMSQAESYQTGLSKEIDLLNDVAGAYKAISVAALQSAKDRAIAKGTQSAIDAYTEEWGKSTSKIQKEFISKFGKEQGSLLLDSLKDSLSNGKELSKEVESAIKSFDRIIYSAQGAAATTQSYQYNPINLAIGNIRDSKKVLDQEREELIGMFGSGSSSGKEEPTIISTYNDQLKSAQDNVSKLKKDLANLRKGIRPVDVEADVQFDFSKNIEEKAKELKDAQDKLSYLTTGQSYSASNKANNAAETAAEKARKTAQKVLDNQLKLDNDKAKASLDARNQELENQQALLNLQEDGFKKEQKQAEINHQKELLSIDKRAQELIEAKQKAERDAWDIKNPNPKTTYVNKTTSIMDLSPEQQASLISTDAISTKGLEKANADLLKNLLEKYQDFAAKKTAIEKQYNKDVQALESQRTAQNSAEIDRAIAQLNKERKEATSAIDLNAFKESINWEQAFGDLDKVSTSALEDLREKLRKYILTAGDSISIQDLKAVSEAIDGIDEKLKVKSPFSSLINGFKELSAAGKDATKQAIAYRKIINSLEEVNTLVDGLSQAFSDLSDAGIFSKKDAKNAQDIMGYLQGSVTASAGLGKVLSGDMSGIKDMISGTSQMIKSVSSLFGKRDKAAEDTKRLQDVTEKVSVANDAINSLLEKRIELIKESTAAERQHLSVLTNESLDAYQDYYDEQFNRLLGNDLYGKKGKNNNLSVEDVMKMYGLSSPEDFAKWWQSGGYGSLTLQGYDLRDKDKYDSWASAYMDMIDKRKELAQTMNEEATQISFDSFRDSFLDTLSDMDSSSKDFAENFEGYLQKAMLNSLLTEKYQERIKNLYSMFSDYNADGNIDESEYKKLQDYEKQLTDDMIADRDRLKKSFGWDSSTSQSASSGYSTSMSQDTGEAIEGRTTAMHMNLISIDSNVARIAEWAQPFDMKYNVDVLTAPLSALSESCQRIELMLEQNRNIAIQSYYELKDINKQTKELYPIRTGIDTMNKTLSNL